MVAPRPRAARRPAGAPIAGPRVARWVGGGRGRIALGCWLLGVAGSSAPAAAAPKRFDHVQHERSAKLSCNRCHKLRRRDDWSTRRPVGARGEVHSPCSDAGCHAQEFRRIRGRRRNFCLTCHQKRISGRLRFPPYRARGASDFVLGTLSHPSHAGVSRCGRCHVDQAGGSRGLDFAPVGHARCGDAGCHAKVAPKMTDCAGCHRPKTGAVGVRASREKDLYRVTRRFDHEAHARAARRDDCGDCHLAAAIAPSPGGAVALPNMPTCERCHDGRTAFAALGTKCGKCHAKP